jgi:hypothetical protein
MNFTVQISAKNKTLENFWQHGMTAGGHWFYRRVQKVSH